MSAQDQITAMRNIIRIIAASKEGLRDSSMLDGLQRNFHNGKAEGILAAVNVLTYCDNPEDSAAWAAFEKELIELLKQS